jgi:hypothetical protein
MVNDRDVVKENEQLLMGRWRFLKGRRAYPDAAQLGMKQGFIDELRSLDEIQVRRAADCASPLFRFSQPDAVLIEVLRPLDGPPRAFLRSEVDTLIETENEVVLINRWNAARISVLHCECLLGLSPELIERLREATLFDLQQAAQRGVRLCEFGPRHQYLFHAGRNLGLYRSNRTVLAVCANARRAS